jgi:crossover junction endodeoxyribonuclease RuvC
MAPKLIVGLDPGLSGGIALLGLDGALKVLDMPTVEIDRGGKARREIDTAALADLLRDAGAAHAWLERVASRPGQGVASMFAFGRGVGQIEGVLAALRLPMSYVTPQAWRKALRVPDGKDGSRLRASQIMPAYAGEWRRAKDDGRAEAALIAMYGLQATAGIVGAAA